MNIKNFVIALVTLVGLTATAQANNQHSLPALQGYDVVSYHTGKRPVRGNGNFVANYQGATYQFSSKHNRTLFEGNPGKYTPAYGGYCAFGVSVGKKFIGDPEVWRLVDGKLYLNLDTGIQTEWLKDVPGRIKLANGNWRDIKHRDAASL